MSSVSAAAPEFDFWEFVNCAKCHLPFISGSGAPPPVPFWITECGHVVCNNHLNPDQSCAQCGRQGIQLIPLQQEMDAPMGAWFSSAPLALDALTFSVRFQMDTMASLVRYYKNKYKQQRSLLDRLKDERTTYKKSLAELRLENDELRQYLEYGQGHPSNIPNSNGKRRMIDPDHAPRTNSSPRSIATPLGPDRLTLPPDIQQPNLSSRHTHSSRPDDARFAEGHRREPSGGYIEQQERKPGSSRFVEEYAYAPPQPRQSPPMSTPTLSHAQSATIRHAQSTQSQGQGHAREEEARRNRTSMIPPSSVSRDPRRKYQPTAPENAQSTYSQQHNQHTDSRTNMGPPPLPPQLQQRASLRPPATPQPPTSARSSRFMPPTPLRPGTIAKSGGPMSSRFPPQQSQEFQSNRFLPLQSSDSQRFGASAGPGSGYSVSGSSLQTPSRAASMSMNGGGQRMPFVPGGA